MPERRNKIQKRRISYARWDSVKLSKAYRILFWLIYLMIFLLSVIVLKNNLSEKKARLILFDFRLDHLLHFLFFYFFSLYQPVGRYFGLHLFRTRPCAKYAVSLLLLCFCSEFIQLLIPWRSFNPADLVSNVTGSVAGIFTGSLINKENFRLVKYWLFNGNQT